MFTILLITEANDQRVSCGVAIADGFVDHEVVVKEELWAAYCQVRELVKEAETTEEKHDRKVPRPVSAVEEKHLEDVEGDTG